MTWAPAGTKQVSLVGTDEKWAFTLMVSVAADGTLLPFQAIYVGKTKVSCPTPSTEHAQDVATAGFHLEFSGTATYVLVQSTDHARFCQPYPYTLF